MREILILTILSLALCSCSTTEVDTGDVIVVPNTNEDITRSEHVNFYLKRVSSLGPYAYREAKNLRYFPIESQYLKKQISIPSNGAISASFSDKYQDETLKIKIKDAGYIFCRIGSQFGMNDLIESDKKYIYKDTEGLKVFPNLNNSGKTKNGNRYTYSETMFIYKNGRSTYFNTIKLQTIKLPGYDISCYHPLLGYRETMRLVMNEIESQIMGKPTRTTLY
ncbi:MAG: hypothetical protein HOE90_20430 [Bacteriovoracaceae bacterium]|jgi:hypothetical protein|nr:hypothetical protein [Bacteriovoracaceae bacterium]